MREDGKMRGRKERKKEGKEEERRKRGKKEGRNENELTCRIIEMTEGKSECGRNRESNYCRKIAEGKNTNKTAHNKVIIAIVKSEFLKRYCNAPAVAEMHIRCVASGRL